MRWMSRNFAGTKYLLLSRKTAAGASRTPIMMLFGTQSQNEFTQSDTDLLFHRYFKATEFSSTSIILILTKKCTGKLSQHMSVPKWLISGQKVPTIIYWFTVLSRFKTSNICATLIVVCNNFNMFDFIHYFLKCYLKINIPDIQNKCFTMSVCMHVLLPATVQWCTFPFCLYDSLQLALIKSHLGTFDSKVPVSPLSNHTVTQAAHEWNLRQALLLQLASFSFMKSHQAEKQRAKSSTVKASRRHPFLEDIFLLQPNS